MRKVMSFGAAMASVALAANVLHAAVAQQATVGVGAIVNASPSTLSVKVLNSATGVELVSPNNKFDFGTPSNAAAPWSTLATQCLEIAVGNSNPWELKTYTDNFNGAAPAAATWGLQYGGMIGSPDSGKKVGIGWAVKPTRVNASTIAGGNPQFGRLTDANGNWVTGGNGFTYLKDKSDQDDPTVEGPQEFQYSSGYINIAFGGYDSTRIVRPELLDALPALASKTAPFYYYIEGNFGGAMADTYTTTIHLDLVNL